MSVLAAGQRLRNEPGNAFIADDGHEGSVPLTVRAAWDSDSSLRLDYDARLRTFRKVPEVRGIKLSYAVP